MRSLALAALLLAACADDPTVEIVPPSCHELHADIELVEPLRICPVHWIDYPPGLDVYPEFGAYLDLGPSGGEAPGLAYAGPVHRDVFSDARVIIAITPDGKCSYIPCGPVL